MEVILRKKNTGSRRTLRLALVWTFMGCMSACNVGVGRFGWMDKLAEGLAQDKRPVIYFLTILQQYHKRVLY